MAVDAAANEPSSATFANIASPSKSGSFDIDNPATMGRAMADGSNGYPAVQVRLQLTLELISSLPGKAA
ncbi:hypothetical protein AYM40_34425 [Paraburkholderia phytofirmans OLGA172]|uniref:Uncharacterized protein n=1 Tax=Paraburkholderia phytofirmans OLGA172 TaxID=1417228 RepID=A0A160FW92_9BURK|nr:hypothetical protein AYM40_34425 [Paraburkholderia phytofirmans OLGA172]